MNASKPILTAFAIISILINPKTILCAQDFDIPRSSPKASISQHIGVTQIKIEYCRPSTKGRKIFGELIPFGRIWRAGANEATTISFPHQIQIEGESVPAGKYALFTIPDTDNWTIILNSDWNQWGAYRYQADKDVLRVEVRAAQSEFIEQFTISFSEVTKTSGVISLQWENTRINFTVETNTYANTLSEIDEVTRELKDNWYVYSAAAQYHFYELKNTEEAIKLINVAITLEAPNPAPWMLKSQIFAYEEKYEEAIKQARLALEVCNNHNFPHEIQENEEQIKKWEKFAGK